MSSWNSCPLARLAACVPGKQPVLANFITSRQYTLSLVRSKQHSKLHKAAWGAGI